MRTSPYSLVGPSFREGLVLEKIVDQPIEVEGASLFFERCGSLLDRRQLFSKLTLSPNSLVLDAGCNCGTNSFILLDLFPSLRIEACDINEEVIEVAKTLQDYYAKLNKKYNVTFYLKDFKTINLRPFDYLLWSWMVDDFINNEITSPLGDFCRQVNFIYNSGFEGKIILLYTRGHDGIPYSEGYIENRTQQTLSYCHGSRVYKDLLLISGIQENGG